MNPDSPECDEELEEGAGPRPLRRVAVLPAILTLAGIFCGFGALSYAAGGQYANSAKLILIAMLFDSLDGKIARLMKMTSSFGAHLDSLADVISFGVAPAFLALRFAGGTLYHPSGNLPVAFSASLLHPAKWIWTISMLYIMAAALRLARFNIESDEDVRSHNAFRGLPTPAAAGVVASIILLVHYIKDDHPDIGFDPILIAAWAMPFLTMTLGILMVSRVRYVHLFNILTKEQKPFFFLVEIIFAGVLIAVIPEVALAIVFSLYVLSGLGTWIADRVRGRTPQEETIF
ncbi:MAG: phosphatidylcholine/phosphatidylserine synthase [Planctomycetota bacterium]